MKVISAVSIVSKFNAQVQPETMSKIWRLNAMICVSYTGGGGCQSIVAPAGCILEMAGASTLCFNQYVQMEANK